MKTLLNENLQSNLDSKFTVYKFIALQYDIIYLYNFKLEMLLRLNFKIRKIEKRFCADGNVIWEFIKLKIYKTAHF